eukprot:1079496-Pelagomonas_calceolata.AAC.1
MLAYLTPPNPCLHYTHKPGTQPGTPGSGTKWAGSRAVTFWAPHWILRWLHWLPLLGRLGLGKLVLGS